ncbi:hypothetical protein [Sphingomonas profundi]|uniref:hypothetical protein n=1 Tax=Alterirhizorhabdus profundi TaxID=2681549 RepID=UPI0012E746E5|nr:hypothetical protein [Sphingomonas profundi]
MSYHELIAIRLSSAMRAELNALATSRQTDVGKLVRRLIANELAGSRSRVEEAIDQILYLAIAMDGLLAAHPNPDLRHDMLRLWNERLAEEGHSDAA